MPAKSKKQQRFMCADLGRAEKGRKTRTGMSRGQLADFCHARALRKVKP